jgi:hypothetical protein
MNESENYVKSGWVSPPAAINMESGNVIVRAAVHHSQSIRKKQVLLWVAICSKTNLKIAANCQCTKGCVIVLKLSCLFFFLQSRLQVSLAGK